jgi:formate dehydrogenase subunit beta
VSLVEDARLKVRNTLEEGLVGGVLGLARVEDEPYPYVFEDPAETDMLEIEPKWLFAKLAMNILRSFPADYRLGVICRGCDERALVELSKRNQVDDDRLHIIGMACSAEQARSCLCTKPYPASIALGEQAQGFDPREDEQARIFLTGDPGSRMQRWRTELGRCIKCYGCRNSCPICVCEPCKLEDDLWVRRGEIPADMVSYHLIRAFHLSDTCVACGGCTDACPVNIPLMLLQVAMRETLARDYAYEPGTDTKRVSPVLSDLTIEPCPPLEEPGWLDSLKVNHET